MKTKYRYITILLLSLFISNGCSDYLDIVPDNVATIDHAFKNRYAAESFLFTCYSSMPRHSNPNLNPAFLAGDDMTVLDKREDFTYPNLSAPKISWGLQNPVEPLLNYWSGVGVNSLYVGIRNCNIFLDKIDNATDLQDYEKKKWVSEVKFLKAYYHFFLLRLYGPIPIIKENNSVNASSEEVKIPRSPVDEVVEYICELIDEAIPNLPLRNENSAEENGRIIQPIALAVKAKVRLWAASPLFNGNLDYSDFTGKDGENLVSQEFSENKWKLAKEAAKEALDMAESLGYELYYWDAGRLVVSDSTKVKMNIRDAVCEEWNDEIIWGATDNPYPLQNESQPRFFATNAAGNHHSVTLQMVRQFYSNKGIPIEEDPDFIGVDLYDLKTAGEDHKYYIEEGYETVNLHFNREPRFYADVQFDGALWFGSGRVEDTDLWVTNYKRGQNAGYAGYQWANGTGYSPKKLVSYRSVLSGGYSAHRYSFPIIRLADVYLMYAEALNEHEGPSEEVYKYLDMIRERAGLNGVIDSWKNSINPDKPLSKEGLRKIIQQERMIELAFEGSRFYDLRRWKLAEQYMNKPKQGWDVQGETNVEFYRVTTLDDAQFTRKDYLWPIRESDLLKNTNLVQNPGW